MMKRKIKILGISGSLRANSSASAVLNVVAGLVPEQVEFTIYNGLAEIPAFNDSNDIPEQLKRLLNYYLTLMEFFLLYLNMHLVCPVH
jgi:hypothetical protein